MFNGPLGQKLEASAQSQEENQRQLERLRDQEVARDRAWEQLTAERDEWRELALRGREIADQATALLNQATALLRQLVGR